MNETAVDAVTLKRLRRIACAAIVWRDARNAEIKERMSNPYPDRIKLAIPVDKALDKLAEALGDQNEQ